MSAAFPPAPCGAFHPVRGPASASVLILLLFALIPALLLSGCGMPAPSRHVGGVPGGKPYTVRGRTYHPLLSARGFEEEGLASWYGPGFQGRLTAGGERYDQDAMTAAHTILPLGSVIRVTRVDDGRSVLVRINDRGPFVDGRIIDLSRAAATRLGIVANGTGRVRLRAVEDEPPNGTSPPAMSASAAAPAPRPEGGAFFIRIGAFADRANAERQAAALRAEGHGAGVILGSSRLWNVRIGPWRDESAARRRLEKLKPRHPGAFVTGE